MPKKIDKPLTARNMKSIQPGEYLLQEGLRFERNEKGDGVFKIERRVDNQKIKRTIGKESEGMTLDLAKRAMLDIIHKAQHGSLSLPKGRKVERTLEQFSHDYLKRSEEIGAKNLPKKKAHFKLHLNPFLGQMPITKISSFDVERYRKARKDAGAKVATINQELGTLSHCFNQAVEWGWLNKVPCKVKQEREDNRRIEFLTVEECNRLLEAAYTDQHPQIYLFVAMALHTCMRRSEILILRVENIHLEKGHVFLPKAKAGARVQPITPQLADLLADHLATREHESPWLFPCVGALKTKEGHTKWIDDTFQRVVERAGITGRHITPHVLRHTAITQLVMAGVDLATIQAISGHKTLAMVLRYSHQTNEHVSNAMSILEGVYSGRQNVVDLSRKRSSVPKTSPKHVLRVNAETVNASAGRGLGRNKKYTWLEAFRTSLIESSVNLGSRIERLILNEVS